MKNRDVRVIMLWRFRFVSARQDNFWKHRDYFSFDGVMSHILFKLIPTFPREMRFNVPFIRLCRHITTLQLFTKILMCGLFVVSVVLFQQGLISGLVRLCGLQRTRLTAEAALPDIPLDDLSRFGVDLKAFSLFRRPPLRGGRERACRRHGCRDYRTACGACECAGRP